MSHDDPVARPFGGVTTPNPNPPQTNSGIPEFVNIWPKSDKSDFGWEGSAASVLRGL